jgi:predicted aspartyl protease
MRTRRGNCASSSNTLIAVAALGVVAIDTPWMTASAAGKCELKAVAQVPVVYEGGRLLVAATIDGQPAHMLIDSGSSTSLIFRGAAAAFGMEVVGDGGKAYTAGGIENQGRVTVRDFNLAGFTVHDLTLTASGHSAMSADHAGALGEDFLSHWDEEFEPGASIMRLIVPHECTGDQVEYWAPAYNMVRLQIGGDAWSQLLLADVQVNGHDITAVFDTGAPYTIIESAAVRRPGLHPNMQTAIGQEGSGLGPAKFAIDTATFNSITIGQETIQNPRVVVADIWSKNNETKLGSIIPSEPEGTPEMLIGADFFRAHHVYVARGQRKLYFTYTGGNIFATPHLGSAGVAQPGLQSPSPEPSAAQPPSASPAAQHSPSPTSPAPK